MVLRIQQLSAAVANQIAAGEVIERPASVVKELLENALDAGADNITIDIGFGGLNQIKISDNGLGILADDLPLAIAAHATSKIRQLSDLYAVMSMGFRGEALASIASVSHLTLSSKPATQEHAMKLSYDGSAYQVSPCARGQGTTVDVQDLFYNVPVRKRFLKSPRSEYQAIEMVVKRFALSAPTIAITLNHNDKQILNLPVANSESSRLLRIKKLLGKAFIENAAYLDIEQTGMHLWGWVSTENYQPSQNDKQWFYINQRMVKDKLINHAIKQAYEQLLHPGRYPACLLYLSIAAEEVDVNVHPTKHEVRFQQPRLVHDFISTTIARVLQKPEQESYTTVVPVSAGNELREVRETYVKQPLQATARVGLASPKNWQVLNSDFVLTFLHDLPYLVDIRSAQQDRFASILNQQSFPLAARPLLVPVRYQLDKVDSHYFEPCLAELMQLGIQLDCLGEKSVVVRSLPQLFPQLDIKQLLQRINDAIPSQKQLFELLLDCQSFDAYQLHAEDISLLLHYLEQQVLTERQAISWGVQLDREKCRKIINV